MQSKRANSKDTEYRLKREAILDKSFLIFRQDDLALYLKPTRAMKEGKCVLSGKRINYGDYTYRAYSNPVRIVPTGTERVLVDEAINVLSSYLPYGSVSMAIPTTDKIISMRDMKVMEANRNKQLEQQATKLLKSGERIVR